METIYIQAVCQAITAAFVVASFFKIVREDFEGVGNNEPAGFRGFIATCISTVILVGVLYGAGAFSVLVP